MTMKKKTLLKPNVNKKELNRIENMKNSLIIVFCLFSLMSCNIAKYFQQKYYKDSYEPQYITTVNSSKVKFHSIPGLTCYSYSTPYCQSASLQISHSTIEANNDINYYNWIMGFSYGAYFNKMVGIRSFIPYNDPEIGFIQGQEYLGYNREYLVSDDSALFVSKLRELLKKDMPVRVAINSSILSGQNGFYPHSIILVGFNLDTICYFETGMGNRAIKNYEGEKTTINQLIPSIKSFCTVYNHPWSYQLTSFDFNSFNQNKRRDIFDSTLESNNGNSLLGNIYGPVSIGSKSYKGLAEFIDKNGTSKSERDYLIEVLKFGKQNRKDNALFLKFQNKSNTRYNKISSLFIKSSELHDKCLYHLKNYDKNNLANVLKEISTIETQIGNLLIKKVPNKT
mgnify:CR=1 FL=1